MAQTDGPRLVVLSTLFPHAGAPGSGLFIRERMFRVGKQLPLVVVSPQPWFPLQGLIRKWRPHFRAAAPKHEVQQGIDVYYPRFFSVPGMFKSRDGFFMALGALPMLLRLRRRFGLDLIDAHFAFPDGYAATLLGKWLRMPVTITLRGTEPRLARDPRRRRLIASALKRARAVFAVSRSLRELAIELGTPEAKTRVMPNGVDTDKFTPVPKDQARKQLNLPTKVPVLISVGALVERKGFHRVLEILPALRGRFPHLHYLIVGGPSPEGDWSARLHEQAQALGVGDAVRFVGALPPDELKVPLSAADVFVLSTRNEGWANVFLEAMACGLPVVTTDVGGNREVVSRSELGMIVPFADPDSLQAALAEALTKSWDRPAIRTHAEHSGWDGRVAALVEQFRSLLAMPWERAGERPGTASNKAWAEKKSGAQRPISDR